MAEVWGRCGRREVEVEVWGRCAGRVVEVCGRCAGWVVEVQGGWWRCRVGGAGWRCGMGWVVEVWAGRSNCSTRISKVGKCAAFQLWTPTVFL